MGNYQKGRLSLTACMCGLTFLEHGCGKACVAHMWYLVSRSSIKNSSRSTEGTCCIVCCILAGLAACPTDAIAALAVAMLLPTVAVAAAVCTQNSSSRCHDDMCNARSEAMVLCIWREGGKVHTHPSMPASLCSSASANHALHSAGIRQHTWKSTCKENSTVIEVLTPLSCPMLACSLASCARNLIRDLASCFAPAVLPFAAACLISLVNFCSSRFRTNTSRSMSVVPHNHVSQASVLKCVKNSLSKYHEPLTLLPISLCELRTCSASKTDYCIL